MIDKRLMRLPGMRTIMTMLAGLALVQAFVILGQGHFLAAGIVHAWQRKPLSGLWLFVIGFAAAYTLRQLITWLRNVIAERFARKTAGALQQQLLAKVYALGPQLAASEGTGNLVTMALDGIPETQNYIELILNKILNMMIIPWVLLVYIFMQQHLAGIALLIMFPVIILFMIILGYAARDESEKQYAGFQSMSNQFIDSLRGLKTLQLMGISKQYADNVYQVSERYRKQTMNVLKIAMLSSFAMDFFATLSIAVVAVFMGIDLLNGSLALYPAMVALILAPEYFMPIREFGNDYHATLNGKNAMNAVLTVLAQPVPTPVEGLPELTGWDQDATLSAEHLNFTYPGRETGVSDASFTLHGGQKVAIIGPSGSGKSTLLNLIGGFLQPDAGTTPFTANGHALPHMAQPAWQDHLSYIPQAPYIFATSIADNVRFYRPDATADEVAEAVAQAGLTDWIKTLPDGLDTRIGEGGRGISGGQAQRIALGRTLLDAKRQVWLFDEPTAHLDIETEAALKATLVPLFKDRLVIFATHRLHWLNQMDWVIVMAEGRIVAQGTPADLQAHSKPYQELVAEMRGEFNVQA
ncbi:MULTISPECIES: thiol reductant ABC exporter subunit CydD [unclassified Lacticaseibacillus]|uniref:thiol reductant ABC exporter subunit CydD n=1 Tax=unclassified Lacticaseibacillus TaxID=2759744 RepID=UPI0019451276|nr:MULTISPECIES: thiol reductant ABC exporter subunit CydD [unclassified Lacticaseibacillus]